MPTIFSKRKILKVGDALGITIPKSIIVTHSLKKGDRISVISDVVDYADGLVVIDLKGRSVEELWELMK